METIKAEIKRLSFIAKVLLVLQIIQLAVIVLLLGFNFTSNPNQQKGQTYRNSASAKGIPGKVIRQLIDSNQFVGSKDAKVSMIVFSGFECYHCESFFDSIYPRIYNDFVKTGMVRFTLIPFVKKDNELALYKAKILICAGFQGKRWEMHSLLMKKQGEIPQETLNDLLKGLNINIEQFNVDLKSQRVEQIVKFNKDFTSENNISGTPFFIINSQMTPGNRPYDAFKKIIETEIRLFDDLSQRHTGKSCD